MPLVSKSRAIVLHTTRQGDNALVVNVLDENLGRCSLFLRGVGRKSGRTTAAFHSLNVLDIVTVTIPQSSMPLLKEFTPVLPLDSLRSDIRKSSIAIFICEVLFRVLRSGDGDESLLGFLQDCAVELNGARGNTANFHLWWLAAFCCRMGFRPEDNYSPSAAPLFDIASARFVRNAAGGGNPGIFPPEDSILLHRMLTSTLEEALEIPLPSAGRQSFARHLLAFLSHHLGQSLNIRSLDVLHAVFN